MSWSFDFVSYFIHANSYVLAESLDQQMQQMEQSLSEIIEHINTASAERNPNAPVSNSLN